MRPDYYEIKVDKSELIWVYLKLIQDGKLEIQGKGAYDNWKKEENSWRSVRLELNMRTR